MSRLACALLLAVAVVVAFTLVVGLFAPSDRSNSDEGLSREELWRKYAPDEYREWRSLKGEIISGRGRIGVLKREYEQKGEQLPDDYPVVLQVRAAEVRKAECERRMEAALAARGESGGQN